VERLAAADYEVYFTFRASEQEAAELAERTSAVAVPADFTDPERAAAGVFGRVAQSSGRLDVLVNNARSTSPARWPRRPSSRCGG
jgi:NAD(P)-dependent dehydrogenase (short-subunit alcohol dehydrogenase family)